MSIKILLADDSITIQKVIGIIFGGEEYALAVVDNGKAAIEKARETSPDILLIDALMPGMSGYEVCEAIRATPELAAKPILLLTGTFEPFDEERAKSCGADDFLPKPFESQQIVTKVRELFELGASRAIAAPQSGSIAEPSPFEQTVPLSAAETATTEEDIWGAFTPATEPVLAAAQPQDAASEQTLEPDVFAIINEEAEELLEQPKAFEAAQADATGSEWIPVEEHTFEFETEAVAEMPAASITGLEPPDQEISFGEITFEEESQAESTTARAEVPPPIQEQAPSKTQFAEPPPTVTKPDASVFATLSGAAESKAGFVLNADETAPLVLSEAQLKAAIAAVSQEVIERIVWEVVPDLAEALIKDAIRRIKEGL